jgi:hypothetical protein
MSEQPAASSPETNRCPWCSTISPVGTETCPSCGAALIATAENTVPGVTAIDAEAVLRGRGQTKSRGGILGFLSGETGDTVDTPSAAELSSLAPPTNNVRIEMMRLELEAERQRLEAEAAGMAADAVVDGEIPAIPPGVVPPVDEDGFEAGDDEAIGDTAAAAGAQPTAPMAHGSAASPSPSAPTSPPPGP